MKLSRRTPGVPKRRHATHSGDLPDPIVFLRSTREPDENTSFIQTLTPFFRAWAKFTSADRSPEMLGDSEYERFHTFLIRNPIKEDIRVSDQISHGQDIYTIVSTRPNQRRDFLFIKARLLNSTASPSFSKGKVLDGRDDYPMEAEQADPGNTSSLFWPEEAPERPPAEEEEENGGEG